MKRFSKNKLFLLLSTVLSVFAVTVCGLSTLAWFQLDSQSPEFENTTADTNLNIVDSEVTGYKIQSTLGTDGFPSYDSNTVAHKKGSTYETDNHNQDNADTNFDVPAAGLGYYLIKKNPSDTYKYQYNGTSTGWSWKFQEFVTSGINYLKISSSDLGELTDDDSFIIREYSYDAGTYKTVNVKKDISKDSGSFSIDSTTYEIYDITDGYYNILFNKTTKKVSFESVIDINDLNLAQDQNGMRKARREAAKQTGASNTIYFVGQNWIDNCYPYIYYWGTTSGWMLLTSMGSGYKYNDQQIYSATATGSFSRYALFRQKTTMPNNPDDNWKWNNHYNRTSGGDQSLTYSASTDFVSFNNTLNTETNEGDSNRIKANNFTLSNYDNHYLDGWVLIGSRGEGSSTFSNDNWDAAGSVRLDAGSDDNLAQKLNFTFKAGDQFKVAYLKGDTFNTGNSKEYLNFDYFVVNANNSQNDTLKGRLFESYDGNNKNIRVKYDITASIYVKYLQDGDCNKIFLEVGGAATTLSVKAVKFDFKGTIKQSVYASAIGTMTSYVGETITDAKLQTISINASGVGDYTRIGTTFYSDQNCTTAITSFSMTAGKIVYAKYTETRWVVIGKSAAGSETFGDPSHDFAVEDAIQIDDPLDASANEGQVQISFNAGDQFKIVKVSGTQTVAGTWYGFDKLQVYSGGSDYQSAIGTYFEVGGTDNCRLKNDLSCTIYFTKESWWGQVSQTSRWINVNITASVIVKAVKYDFTGTKEGVWGTDVTTHVVSLGTKIDESTINGLTLTNLPTNYSRVGTYVYQDSNLNTRLGNSFYASTNPTYVYIKVQENGVTINLHAYFVDTDSVTTGGIDDSTTYKMTLTTQFGGNSTVTAASLKDIWDDSFNDNITRTTNIKYHYTRIETSAHNSAFSSASGSSLNNTTLYVRYVRDSYTISLNPSYFAPDGTSRLSFSIQQGTNETLLDYDDFTTETDYSNCEYKDDTNAVWYIFRRVDSDWYTDPDCTTTFSNKLREDTPLYAKMVAYPVTTFYVDCDYSTWDYAYIHIWGTLDGVHSSLATSGDNRGLRLKEITTISNDKVYRVSIPTQNVTGFLLFDGAGATYESTDAYHKTVNITVSSLTSSSSKYLYMTANESNARPASFVEYKSTAATNVWVQKYSGGKWSNVTNGQLLHGDGVGNDYILESGLQLTNNDIIRVYNVGSSTAYGYAQYVSVNTSKHTYITGHTVDGEAANSSMQITRIGSSTATARFNFYITHSGEISIAMVPDYGNGYYIMEYNSTDGVENFIGAIKMDSSDYTASYDGWYCGNTSNKIYIRSYMDAVDKICDTLTSTSLTYVKALDGNNCIEFKETGHYNIRVTGQIIDITPYRIGDFFSLNRLDLSLVTGATNTAKQQKIWDQKTAVVMEVPFTANNPYTTVVKLKTECSASWVGIRFAVYSSQQENPYELMHGDDNSVYTDSYLTDASLTAPRDSVVSCTITAGSTGKFYAYILIDYRYTVTSSNLRGATPEVGFYLQAYQS